MHLFVNTFARLLKEPKATAKVFPRSWQMFWVQRNTTMLSSQRCKRRHGNGKASGAVLSLGYRSFCKSTRTVAFARIVWLYGIGQAESAGRMPSPTYIGLRFISPFHCWRRTLCLSLQTYFPYSGTEMSSHKYQDLVGGLAALHVPDRTQRTKLIVGIDYGTTFTGCYFLTYVGWLLIVRRCRFRPSKCNRPQGHQDFHGLARRYGAQRTLRENSISLRIFK